MATLVGISIALAPGLAATQPSSGPEQATSGAASAGQASIETPKPAEKATPSAREVGNRLHDSAKGFGEAILGGIKYAGRKVASFFGGGDKSEN